MTNVHTHAGNPPPLVVLTGAPGTGKTAILDRFDAGIRTFPEPAREILAELRAAGVTEPTHAQMVSHLLRRSIANHTLARRDGGPAVFDRAVPDCAAYAEWLGVDPAPSRQAAATHRYDSPVLVARPWEEIYCTDDERTMTFAATVEFHAVIEAAYLRAGYTLVEIPRGPLAERAAFVAAHVAGRVGR